MGLEQAEVEYLYSRYGIGAQPHLDEADHHPVTVWPINYQPQLSAHLAVFRVYIHAPVFELLLDRFWRARPF